MAENIFVNMHTSTFISGAICLTDEMGYLIRFLSDTEFEVQKFPRAFDNYLDETRLIAQYIFEPIDKIRKDGLGFKNDGAVRFEHTKDMLDFSNEMLGKLPGVKRNNGEKLACDMVDKWQRQNRFFLINDQNKGIFAQHMHNALIKLKSITSKYELCN